MYRLIPVLFLLLSACASAPDFDASSAAIADAVYVEDGPALITLYTMIGNRYEDGAHSALLINASQRVIFDPAGTLRSDFLVVRHDVVYGITPSILDFYTRAHARKTHHVVIQELEVNPDVAELALQLVQDHGPTASGFCARSTSEILRLLPGFTTIDRTLFPKKLMQSFARLPNVKQQSLYEYDDADKSVALRAYEAKLVAGSKARASE